MEDKVWKFVGADSYDVTDKTVSFKSRHFSDWSLMNQLTLSPYKVEVDPGGKIGIKALLFTRFRAGEDLLVPLVNDPSGPYAEPGYPVGEPEDLPSRYVKSWNITGVGKIVKTSNSSVEYTAPDNVNSSASATVSLELKAPVSGQFLLLCQITILGSWIELSIGGGAPVRFPASGVVKQGARYLLSNPENEGGGYFLLAWKGEVGNHTFDLANDGNHFHFQTATTTYMSRYIPGPDSPMIPSGVCITITKMSDGYAEGSFIVGQAGFGPTLMTWTTAQGRFRSRMYINN